MTHIAHQLVRPEILKLQPFNSARTDMQNVNILLNANELPSSPLDTLGTNKGAADKIKTEWNRYPPPQSDKLKQLLSNLYQVGTENLLVTRGSDEAIDLLIRAFCTAYKDSIVQCPPCFGMYSIYANIQAANIIDISLLQKERYALDLDALVSLLKGSLSGPLPWLPKDAIVKLVFLCSPNNPTGNLIDAEELDIIIEAFGLTAIVVIDEAYIDFTDSESMCAKINQYPNLVVLRTLSKAYGMAGGRLGCAIAQPEVIDILTRVISPYPVSIATVDSAIQLLEHLNGKPPSLAIDMVEDRAWLVQQIRKLNWCTIIGGLDANFILIKLKDANKLYHHLLQRGIQVRQFVNYPGLPEQCVRITVGDKSQNHELMAAIQNYLPD